MEKMKKSKIVLVLIVIFFISCNEQKKIIYSLDYNHKENIKSNLKLLNINTPIVKIYFDYIDNNTYYSFIDCDKFSNYQTNIILKNSNRFLDLGNDELIPIFFSDDFQFIDTPINTELKMRTGYDFVYIIDKNGKRKFNVQTR